MADEYSQSDHYDFPNGCGGNNSISLSYEMATKFIPLYGNVGKFYTQFVLPSLLLFGILGNGAFMYVVAKQSSMRTATNKYLVNLAISDILFLTVTIGEKLWKFTHSPFVIDDAPVAPVGCILLPLLGDTAYFASLSFITLVSKEILHAVYFPKGRHQTYSKTWSFWLTVLAWTTSFIFASILVPSSSGIVHLCFEWGDPELTHSWPRIITICGTENEWLLNLSHIAQIVPFFVTLSLNIYLFTRIITALNQSIARLRSHGSIRVGDTELRNQVAKMIVVNGITFFLLLSPFELMSFLKVTKLELSRTHITALTACAHGLMYLNSVVNPIVYTAMSKRYREAFMNSFCPGPKCVLAKISRRPCQISSTYNKASQISTKL